MAPFVLVLSSAEWASPVFVSIIALGETLWAPRFYTYTHEIAPPDEVGFYFSMSQVPLFLPKLIAGVMSGWLLAKHCAVDSGCEGGAWLWWHEAGDTWLLVRLWQWHLVFLNTILLCIGSRYN